jgi:Pro-kumamolisin, activation domain
MLAAPSHGHWHNPGYQKILILPLEFDHSGEF